MLLADVVVGAGGEAGLGELRDLGLTQALDDLQLRTFRPAIEGGLDHGHQRGLAGRPAPALATTAHVAQTSVPLGAAGIPRPHREFDPAAHLRLAGVALFHGSHQLLPHQPRPRPAENPTAKQAPSGRRRRAVGWRTPSRRTNSIELIPPLACVNS